MGLDVLIGNVRKLLACDGSPKIERFPQFMISKFASASYPGLLPVAVASRQGDALRKKCATWRP